MKKETYLLKAFRVIQPQTEPNEENLFDSFTEQDTLLKPGRFLVKPKPILEEKPNLDSLYTDRTATCPRCKNNEFYRVTKQTRASDEGESIFFLCKYCKKPLKI